MLFSIVGVTLEPAMQAGRCDLTNIRQTHCHCIPVIPHTQPGLNYGIMPGILALIHVLGLQWYKEIFTSFRNNSV